MSTFERNIKQFADEHGVVFKTDSEIGFGRPCAGLLYEDHYVEFNPMDDDYEYLPEFHDPRLDNIKPEHAYHKGNFIAVLGDDENAVAELSNWVDELRKLEVTMQPRKAPASTLQGLLGKNIMTIKTKE